MTDETKKLLLIFNALPRERQLLALSSALESLSMMAMMMGCPNGEKFGEICEAGFITVNQQVMHAMAELNSHPTIDDYFEKPISEPISKPVTEIDKVEMEHLNRIWNMI